METGPKRRPPNTRHLKSAVNRVSTNRVQEGENRAESPKIGRTAHSQPNRAPPLQQKLPCKNKELKSRSASDHTKTNKLCIIYVFAVLTRAITLQYVTFILRP